MANERLIKNINDAFLKVLTEENAKQYEQYFKKVNREMIKNVDNLNANKVKQILKEVKINVNNAVDIMLLQSTIVLALQDKRKAKKNPNLLPALLMLGMYSTRNSEKFVRQVVKINKGVNLSNNEQTVHKAFKRYFTNNTKVVQQARKIAIEKTELSVVKSKRNKRMLRDFKRLRQDGKSIKEIENNLQRKYNNEANIKRVINTELHEQTELVKTANAKQNGFTHKKWIQRNRPTMRETSFHNHVVNTIVPIDSDFRANGLRASYPGDDRLPPQERIYCDCYLIFINK